MPRYGPPDAFETPRFSGPRTFMRLPHVRDLEGVDVAIVGIPTDGAVVYRSGARFGPEGIRSASVMLRNFNPLLGVDVVERLSLVDYGDVPTVPGSTADSLERSERALAEVVDAGVTTLCLGGDHTVLLAELRALARKHGPLALIQLDSHHDLWDEYFGQKLFHGSVVRRAVEEGLVDPSRSVQAGLRGSLGSAEEAGYPAELGIDALTYEELAALGPAGFSQRVRNRVGDAPCFLTLRHRLRRPGIRARDRDARGGRAVEPGSSDLRPLACGTRLSGLRLRRGLAAVRPCRADGVRGGERVLRDALVAGPAAVALPVGDMQGSPDGFPSPYFMRESASFGVEGLC